MELNKLLLIDQDKICALQSKIKQIRSSRQPIDKLEIKLDQLIDSSIRSKEKLNAATFTISYPPELPITSKVPEIQKLIKETSGFVGKDFYITQDFILEKIDEKDYSNIL